MPGDHFYPTTNYIKLPILTPQNTSVLNTSGSHVHLQHNVQPYVSHIKVVSSTFFPSGPKLMKIFNLAPIDGYSTCYDPEVNPSLMTEFAGAAMRYGHSTVDGKIK